MKNIIVSPKKAFVSLFIILLVTVLVFASEYRTSFKVIESAVERYLEESIYTYTFKFLDTRSYIHNVANSKEEDFIRRKYYLDEMGYTYDHYQDSILFFQDNDDWDYRTSISDSAKIVTRMVKKKKHIPVFSLIYQSRMMESGEIEVDTIVEIFKKTLYEEKGIQFFSPIYLSLKTDLNDTIQYKNFENEEQITYNYVPPAVHTGYLDEVIYQPYLNISVRTIYHSMPKHYLIPLYFLTICLFLNFIWCLLKDSFHKRNTEIQMIDDNPHRYYVGHVLFDFDKQILYYREEHKLNYKTAVLLLKLLQSKDHTLTKKQVESLCTGASNITTHMHTLRAKLEKSTCRYTVSSFKRTGYYQLRLKESSFKGMTLKLKNLITFRITIRKKKPQ